MGLNPGVNPGIGLGGFSRHCGATPRMVRLDVIANPRQRLGAVEFTVELNRHAAPNVAGDGAPGDAKLLRELGFGYYSVHRGLLLSVEFQE
jgi:hypothetical protein